jgi:hypothetical protein
MLHIKDIEDFASISEALNRAEKRDLEGAAPPQQEKGAPAKPTPPNLFTRMLRRR